MLQINMSGIMAEELKIDFLETCTLVLNSMVRLKDVYGCIWRLVT